MSEVNLTNSKKQIKISLIIFKKDVEEMLNCKLTDDEFKKFQEWWETQDPLFGYEINDILKLACEDYL